MTDQFFTLLEEARFFSFNKETLTDYAADRYSNPEKVVDDFFSTLHYLIRKAYHTTVPLEDIYRRLVENGYYHSQREMVEDELLYFTTAIKLGKQLDGDSLGIYVLLYITSGEFRKDKILNL